MYKINRIGPIIDPWGTPMLFTGQVEDMPFIFTWF